jgi:hypothetical protein
MSKPTADPPPNGEQLGGAYRPYGPVRERYVLMSTKTNIEDERKNCVQSIIVKSTTAKAERLMK